MFQCFAALAVLYRHKNAAGTSEFEKKKILQRTRTMDAKLRLTSCFCIKDVKDRHLVEVLKRSLSMPLCSRYCYANIWNHYRKNLSCLYRAFQSHLHSSTHLYQSALPSRQIHYHHPALPAALGLLLLLGEAVRRGLRYQNNKTFFNVQKNIFGCLVGEEHYTLQSNC